MKKLLAVSGLALALSPSAQAFEQPYLGVAVAMPTFTDDKGGDATPITAQLRFGSVLSKHFGIEARLMSTVSEDQLAKSGVTRDVSVDSMYTLGAVGRMRLGDRANIYGFAGYSYAQLTFGNPVPATSPTIESNLNGISYGLGLVVPIFKEFDVEVDFTNYINGDDTLGGLGIGIRRGL